MNNTETKTGPTGREMCEKIVEAGILVKPDGSNPTPKEVWEYSPNGELFMVFKWYQMALSVLESQV